MRTVVSGRSRRSLLAGVLAGGVLAGLLTAGPAWAIPPDGAGPDTPGTSSSVSPSTLQPGGTISFTVSGYPGGETLYIKIDDGIGYGDTSVAGSGVWHMQAIPASGTVSGSFALPSDIRPGAHWLRFLASAYVDPADPGKGVLGFTRRGGADFTVVAPSGGSNAPGSQAGPGGNAPPAGTTVGQGAEQVTGQGGVIAIEPGAVKAAPTTVPEPPAANGEALPPTFGGKIQVSLDGGDAVVAVPNEHAGEWVYVYAFSEPTGLGWQQVAEDGTVTVPTGQLEGGAHRFAALDADGVLLGWAEVELGGAPVAAPETVETAPLEEAAAGFPVVGAIGGGVIVLLGASVLWFLLRRRSVKPAGAAEPAAAPGDAPAEPVVPLRETVPAR